MSVIVTGAAGFVGMHVCARLLARGERVIGVDELNDYYDPRLKYARLRELSCGGEFQFQRMDVSDALAFEKLVAETRTERVIHLAAQAGVRYSIDNPFAYQRANLAGHLSVLEACRRAPRLTHLVYASSSSVYGDRSIDAGGFKETDGVDAPVSLYAASKRACELMSAAYGSLHGLPQSGLRFFTVYGPWGRPDMAYFSFCERILKGEVIDIYNQGRMARDFTYIDDIVDGVVGVLDRPPEAGANRILNIGDSAPVGLMRMVGALEEALGVTAKKRLLPMQPGDVTATFADVSKLAALTGYKPQVEIGEGLRRFVAWRRATDWTKAKPPSTRRLTSAP